MTEDRKIAARKRREQQVRKQKLILAISAVCVIIVLFIYMSSSCGKKDEESVEVGNVGQDTKGDSDRRSENEIEDELEELLAQVRKEAKEAGYPGDVIELLSKNPETMEFVENYGEKMGTAPVKEIEELKKGEIPHLLQWDERWGYAPYGTSIVAVCGCGPTCMSMILSGLTGDKTLTPAKIAAYGTEHHYINEDNDTYWIFMSEVCENWGVKSEERKLEEIELKKELQAGHPVICSVGPGDFTKSGHFIVLAGYEEDKVIVHDPFSKENTMKKWEFEQFKDQIKSMWIYTVEEE